MKINWSEVFGFISGLLVLFHESRCLFSVPVSCYFDYCGFVGWSEVWEGDNPNFFCLLVLRLLWLLGVLWLHMNFRIILVL